MQWMKGGPTRWLLRIDVVFFAAGRDAEAVARRGIRAPGGGSLGSGHLLSLRPVGGGGRIREKMMKRRRRMLRDAMRSGRCNERGADGRLEGAGGGLATGNDDDARGRFGTRTGDEAGKARDCVGWAGLGPLAGLHWQRLEAGGEHGRGTLRPPWADQAQAPGKNALIWGGQGAP